MITIECQHQLPFPRSEVFGAGIMSDNLPKTISGLMLRTSDEILHEKSILHIGLEIPKVPTIAVESRVTEFLQNERVSFQGKSPIGRATILFALAELSPQTTEVSYRLEIGISRMFGPLGSPIKNYLKGNIDEFTDEYMSNVARSIMSGSQDLKKVA